jgi:hypothetical protein
MGAVWLRSTREADILAFFTRSGALQGVASHRGGVILFISELRFSDSRRLTFAYDHTSADVFDEIMAALAGGQETTHKALGFEATAGALSINAAAAPRPYRLLRIPYWFLAVLTQVGPLRRWLRLTRADRRARKGRCSECGYDLRGAAGRCPECGAGSSEDESAKSTRPDHVSSTGGPDSKASRAWGRVMP